MSEIAISKREDGTHLVSLEGFIGEDYWSGGGNTAAAFKAALAKVPRNEAVTVSINSEGGSIQEGLGIYNAIRERKNVTTRVDGYALSIASLIAIAGDNVISPKASVWMIHNPWTFTAGDSEEHRRAAESLDVNADVLAGVMSEKTGKSKEEILEAMKSETWFSGEQAVEYGLATAMTDEPVKVTALARTYRHPMSFDRTKVMLNNFRAPKPEAAKTAEKESDANMETKVENKAAEGRPVADNAELLAVRNELKELRDAQATERKARIEARCAALCAERELDPAKWIPRAMADESVLKDIEAIKVPKPAPAGEGPRIERGPEGPLDVVKAIKGPAAQVHFMRNNWTQLRQAEANFKGRPLAANTGTDNATLLGTFLTTGFILVLQQKCAALRALTTDFTMSRLAPLQPVIIRTVTAGGTVQTNPTTFEDTTNLVGTVAPVTVTPAHIYGGGYLTSIELNSGNLMGQWLDLKAHEMADKLMGLVAAVVTTGNFTATPHTSASASFGGGDMRELWGRLKKANRKHAILDGEYYAQLLPATREEFNVLEASWPGYNGVFMNTVWTGATANTVGFFCDPQAIGIVAGVPLTSPRAAAAGLEQSMIQIPGIELSVERNSWYNTATRHEWMTFEVMFGAAKLDASAGIILASS